VISEAYPCCAPEIVCSAPLLFVINLAAGHQDAGTTRQVIEAALHRRGRTAELLFARPQELAQIAHQAALRATAQHSAVVAVGGDGTINTVAQAAHACGCAMGVLPQGTFNYFARTHGISTDMAQAAQVLLQRQPVPVQVGLINEHVFLVNASLGLYPRLLQEREANKTRFGRGRLVALGSALVTWLGPHRLLQLHIERGESVRDVKTAMLFIGNNRLQLDQVGWPQASALDEGYMAAVMLRPMGTLAMLWLLLRGSVGQLGDAGAVESFTFHRLVVKPRMAWGHRGVKVAFDGEVCKMCAPLEFRVSPKPLYLLKPATKAPSSIDTEGRA
jgi:diacylglycerol kinase family enzyme